MNISDNGEGSLIETYDFTVLCRICGLTSDDPLFSLLKDNQAIDDLIGKIEQHLAIKIIENDYLPLQVCMKCTNQIISWHKFYEHCKGVEKRFKEILMQESSEDETVINNELCTVKTFLNEDDGGNWNESIVEMNDVNLEETIEECIPDSEINSENNINGSQDISKFNKDIYLVKSTGKKFHNNSMTNDSITRVYENSKNDDSYKKQEIIKWLRIILIEAKYKNLKCFECKFDFSNIENLKQHIAAKHKEYLQYLVFKQKPLKLKRKFLSNALIMYEGKPFYQCSQCKKRLTTRESIRCHMRIHTGELPFKCLLCEKSFRSLNGLDRHIKATHFDIKSHTCDICNHSFKSSVSLKEHSYIHSGETKYKCDVCFKSFRQKSCLFTHKRTHTDYYPFKCKFCKKLFRSRAPLNLHITLHTGEKNHACQYCDRKFRLKSDKSKHEKLHCNIRPFKCTECQKGFKLKKYLAKHYQLHQEKKSKTVD